MSEAKEVEAALQMYLASVSEALKAQDEAMIALGQLQKDALDRFSRLVDAIDGRLNELDERVRVVERRHGMKAVQ